MGVLFLVIGLSIVVVVAIILLVAVVEAADRYEGEEISKYADILAKNIQEGGNGKELTRLWSIQRGGDFVLKVVTKVVEENPTIQLLAVREF
jgi:hypothetical protein